MNAPAEPGNYEMRVYSADPATDADLVDSAPFTVKYFTANNITVKLNKSIYDAEEEMTVIVSGATNEQINSNAYVAIYKAGARADQWGNWERISSLIAEEWKIKAPKEAGNYEMRVYVVDPPVDEALIAMATFSAGTGAPQVLTVESGIKLEWPAVPDAVGYKVYRSRTSGTEGKSVTDFMITSINYVDANVDANTTYYYISRAIHDKRPLRDINLAQSALSAQ